MTDTFDCFKMSMADTFIKDFKDKNRIINKEVLDNEIKEIEETISNERLWVKGSETSDEEIMHMKNIENLSKYLSWLKNQKEAI